MDLGLGDGVEDDAAGFVVWDRESFLKVPGNGLPFTVQVGGKKDFIALLGKFFQLVDDLGAAFKNHVLGLKGFQIDAHRKLALAAGGEIAHMAHARLHDVIVAEVFIDRFGLCGGFNDDELRSVFCG